MQLCITNVKSLILHYRAKYKYSWPKILYCEKMADGAGASEDAPEQPEGILTIIQLIDKLESIVDQIVQE